MNLSSTFYLPIEIVSNLAKVFVFIEIMSFMEINFCIYRNNVIQLKWMMWNFKHVYVDLILSII